MKKLKQSILMTLKLEYSNDMDEIYKSTEQYNSNKKHKILIVLHDMNADMLSNKIFNPVVIELL